MLQVAKQRDKICDLKHQSGMKCDDDEDTILCREVFAKVRRIDDANKKFQVKMAEFENLWKTAANFAGSMMRWVVDGVENAAREF